MLSSTLAAESRVWDVIRMDHAFRATAHEVARSIGRDEDDVREALDDLVSRSVLRRHEVPGGPPVYWC